MSLSELQALLGSLVRVVINDGRVIEGELSCMDKDLNFILGNATEFHGLTEDHWEDSIYSTHVVHKYIGNAMVPGKHVRKVFSGK